tara:strand:- start:981 stop:2024 length:1044 start_codon:yes stop_codon:yes gene_type:complete
VIIKLDRQPEKFETFELFATFCARNSIDLNAIDSLDRVVDLFQQSIQGNIKNLNLIYGKRTESMFAFVASGCGRCILVKQEDGGEIYCNEEISIPDFRVVLDDNTTTLVEVKNFHKDITKNAFKLTKKYFDGLKTYSRLCNAELRIAIYLSQMNKWILLSPSDFKEHEETYEIAILDAFKKDEMSLLGDMSVATTAPLEIYFEADQSKPISLNEETGQILFTTKNVTFGCNGKELNSDAEKALCFSFANYGNWRQKEPVLVMNENLPIGALFRFEPECPTEGQGFEILGSISSLLSNMYKSITENQGEVIATKVNTAPQNFHALIPLDYKSENLPLWRFTLQPNKGD